jgi:hypothetical protein
VNEERLASLPRSQLFPIAATTRSALRSERRGETTRFFVHSKAVNEERAASLQEKPFASDRRNRSISSEKREASRKNRSEAKGKEANEEKKNVTD